MERFLIVLLFLISYDAYSQTAEEYRNLGRDKVKNGNYIEAILDFTKAIELKTSYASAYYERASAKAKINDNKGAIEDYSEFIKIVPDYAQAYNNRGLAKRGTDERWINILNDFDKAIELEPNNSDFYYYRARSKMMKGLEEESAEDYNQAIEDFTMCIEINPKDKLAWFYRGKTQLNKVDMRVDYYTSKFSSIRDFTQVIMLDPTYGRAYTNRAIARVKGANKRNRKDRKLFKESCSDVRIGIRYGERANDLIDKYCN